MSAHAAACGVRSPPARPAKLALMRGASGGGRLVRIALLPCALAGLVLVLAQLFLPGIAARRISSRVGRYGRVISVSVSAWPAIKLLWGRADSVTVRAGSLDVTPAQTGELLSEAAGAARMDVSAASVREGLLLLRDARLRKRGAGLAAEGLIGERDVRAALPAGIAVELLASARGRVTVRVSGGLFGLGASVDAVAEASEGGLVAHPLGGLLEGVRLTLFSDPRLSVEGVSANVESEQPPTYRLGITARMR